MCRHLRLFKWPCYLWGALTFLAEKLFQLFTDNFSVFHPRSLFFLADKFLGGERYSEQSQRQKSGRAHHAVHQNHSGESGCHDDVSPPPPWPGLARQRHLGPVAMVTLLGPSYNGVTVRLSSFLLCSGYWSLTTYTAS